MNYYKNQICNSECCLIDFKTCLYYTLFSPRIFNRAFIISDLELSAAKIPWHWSVQLSRSLISSVRSSWPTCLSLVYPLRRSWPHQFGHHGVCDLYQLSHRDSAALIISWRGRRSHVGQMLGRMSAKWTPKSLKMINLYVLSYRNCDIECLKYDVLGAATPIRSHWKFWIWFDYKT